MQTDRLSPNSLLQDHEHCLAEVKQTTDDWAQWKKSIKGRKKKPPHLRKLLSPNALFWGLPTHCVIHQTNAARLLQIKSTKRAEDFDFTDAARSFIEMSEEGFVATSAIEAVAWAHALAPLVTRLPEDDWRRLAARLMAVSRQHAEQRPSSDIVDFLLSIEMPLAMAFSLPELSPCKQQADLAKQRFALAMDAILDGEGTPHAKLLPSIQLLLASCTRVLTIDALGKQGRVSKATRVHFDWLTRQTLRWTRPDGTAIFEQASEAKHFDELIKFALKLTKDESDAAAFRLLRGKRDMGDADVPAPTEHSEWAEAATMRTTWSPAAARLAVTFATNSLNLELGVGRQTVISGSCLPKVSIDGTPLTIQSDWEEVCWETDDDMDYVELECQLSQDWCLQRQLLLARDDMFAFIADAIIGPQTATIDYRHAMPLDDEIILEQAEETTEATILGKKRLGTILPLALSEWQSDKSSGRLRVDPARLELQSRGRGLYAPLFVDLNSKRRGKALTWRNLTVAEQLQIVPAEVAVAYRVQIGNQQWVIYRSLAKPGNRTFLGVNLVSEFFVARFHPNGETETIIDVA